MNKVIHFEIPTDDSARAQKFYQQVFDWKFNVPMPGMNYVIAMTGPWDDKKNEPTEKGFINGGMMQRDGDFKYPDIVIEVPDIDAAMKMITQNGGKMVKDKMAVGDMGFSAYFKDTEGNLMGLWQGQPGKM